MKISGSVPSRVFLSSCFAALVVVGGESFVQGDTQLDRFGKTMCSSSTEKDETEVASLSKTEEVKRLTMNPLRLAILRLGVTEPRFISPFNYGKYDGEFTCAYCGNMLFHSNSKYDSKSGWPSFWRSAKGTSIDYKMEFDGRLECRCHKCESHLGHVFLDGPTPSSVEQKLLADSPESDPRGRTGRYLPRFCINGAAMTYRDRKD